jgi:hypothetical protein
MGGRVTNTRRRLKAKRTKTESPHEKHIAAIHRARERAENMTPVGLRRIMASFPELEDLINQLGDLVVATDPTAGKLIDPDSAYVTRDQNHDGIVAFGNIATHRAGVSTHQFRQHQERFRRDLGHLAYRVGVAMGGGDGAIHHEKPRCQRANCPEFGRRQPVGTTECLGCGRAF